MEMNGGLKRHNIKALWNYSLDCRSCCEELIDKQTGYQWVPILPNYFKNSIAQLNLMEKMTLDRVFIIHGK